MKIIHLFNLGTLILAGACATPAPKTLPASRTIAEIEVSDSDISEKKIKKSLETIFHSYLLGQSLLYKFDRDLDKNPGAVMKSDNYHELLAIRTMVDAHEQAISDYYLKLVTVAALPKYSQEQKERAQKSLDMIGEFMRGIATDKKSLPQNLEHLILSSLREKQTELYEDVKAMSESPSITKNDPEVIESFEKNMILLRATRMLYFKEAKNYQVDPMLVESTLAELSKESSFKSFRKQIKKTAKQLKKMGEEVVGRSTSSDVIFPATGSSGNISGRGFPDNTWSLTYDDGPGGKTTPTILKNLKDRNQKATFFMLAKQVEALPTTAKTIAEDGHDLACHSYDHPQVTKLSSAGMDKQISGAQKIIEAKLGKPITLYRLPYGAGVSNEAIRTKIAASKMIHVFWNVDTLDWQDKNPTSIFNRTIKQMAASKNNAGVVLFHDIHSQSVTASTMLMDYFKEKKIKVCTVQAVVDQINKGLPSCEP